MKVVDDIGEMETEDGETISLVEGTQHLLKRSDAEVMIRQGRLEHVL